MRDLDFLEILSFYDRNILIGLISYTLRFEKSYFHSILRDPIEFLKNENSYFPFSLLDKYFMDTWSCV
jgi:hypothetical protein